MKSYFRVFFLFFLLFLWRFSSLNTLELPDEAKIRVEGRIETEPEIVGNNQVFDLRSIKVRTRRFPEFHFGDYLEVVGKVEERVINKFYKEYYLVYPEIKKFEDFEERADKSFGWMKILKKIYRFRVILVEAYNKSLPEPFSSLLGGIVLGIKSQLPKDFFEALRKTGTLHVVVASGMNLTFFTPLFINNLSGIFNRFLLIFVSFIFILFYCALVGFEPPIVRAGIMVSLAYLAMVLGRRRESLTVFIISALVMLFFEPRLIFSLSFQLSFAATAGIIFFSPVLRERGEESEQAGWLRVAGRSLVDDFKTTLSAQLGVVPIIVANFGEISLISLAVNSLVLGVIGPLMWLGVLMAAAQIIFQPLVRFLAILAWPFLFWFVKVVEFFGRLPLASIQAPKVSYWGVWGYYVVLGWVVGRRWQKK